MIDKINLKSGSSSGQPNLQFDATPITIFVGPNNSGKSKVLTEIESYCKSHAGNPDSLILKNLILSSQTEQEMMEELVKIATKNPHDADMLNAYVFIEKISPNNNGMIKVQIDKNLMIKEAKNPNTSRQNYYQFLNMYTLRLDGTNRLYLIHQQPSGDLQQTPQNLLAHLFINNELRKEVRRIIYEAFGKYFVIDPTAMGQLRIRLSDREPNSEREERGWEEDSVKFHRAAKEIEQFSDGVKAFTGIIITLLAGEPKIILIDEPEAFLHPSLSNKLGKEIGNSLRGTKKRLFVSTHSSSFLMGCVQSGSPINIVRLTYKSNVPTARILPNDKVLHLMRHPLLRSTGILNALFYETVIVTEADSDRAFYQEINERLLSAGDERGINNCLFINANGKHTVWDIVKPLRELGIPAVGIVDIDVLKEGGQVFSKPLNGAFIPALSHQAFQNQRQAFLNAFEATGHNMKRDGGVDVLATAEKEAIKNFFDQFESYGVFVIRKGELESWLKPLGATGHGPSWLMDIFEKMGENPDEQNYVKPTGGDVWDFMWQIKKWVDNPNRTGIPL